MKKLITGVLVMALTFTFAFAVPVYAAEVGSAEDSETTTTETKETTTATPEAVTTTKASYDAAHGSGAYEKLISEGTAKVNKAVQSKAELAKVTEVLKNAGVDTTKKTIAKSPTLVEEIFAPAGVTGLTAWSLPEKSFKNTALGTGQYILAHLKSDNTMEYQAVTVKEGVVQEKLTFHGASPIAFYKVTELTASTTKSHKTGETSVAVVMFMLAAVGMAYAGKKAYT